jgi:hypothetical protein
MSYDIDLFKVLPGETVDSALERAFPETEDVNPGPPVPEKEALKANLATVFLQRKPYLEPFKFDFHKIAELKGISEAEARERWRHVELNNLDNGVQLTIFDDGASITVAYWHQAFKAKSVFGEVQDYIEILESEAGYVAYDRQFGEVLHMPDDLPRVLEEYARGVGMLESAKGMLQQKLDKPWWKFW